MDLDLSTEEAARLLAGYHFAPTDIAGVFDRLGTVQFDPLNPIGRNPDLVLQARVSDYRVDDWQDYAYRKRLAYDTWDKQACLVPTADWPCRARIRSHHQPWHDREILKEDAAAAELTLETIERQGPMSSLEFEDRTTTTRGHSWYGSTRIKRILRALWAEGKLVTHHREGSRHYYDLPERVIPAAYFFEEPLTDEFAFYRWIVERRHQAAGLLRPRSDLAIWSACGEPDRRAEAIAQLVESGRLVPVRLGLKRTLYHAHPSALRILDRPDGIEERMIFVAPLDSLLWDRKALSEIFEFSYVWEVYKPERLRTWGYYVVPVFYRNRFVARLDSRLEDGVWKVNRWWWEPDVTVDMNLLEELSLAVTRFLRYLGARKVRLSRTLDRATTSAFRERAKLVGGK